ncbi:hypothetical protein Tco_0386118 [Tanacetum coccineum]
MTNEEETLILEEVNRSKMLAKQNDSMSKEKKVNIIRIDYEKLNQLSKDFGKCFVPQMQLSAEQAFWLSLLNPNFEQPNVTQTPARVEVPKELLKCSVDKKLFEIENKELKLENECLLEHIVCQDVVNIVMHVDVKSVNVVPVQNTILDDNIALDMMKMENNRLMELLVSQDLVHTVVNSLTAINNYKSMEKSYVEAYNQCLELETGLSKRNNMIERSQLQAKNTTISNLKNHIRELKGKSVVDCSESVNKSKLIAPVVHKLDLEPLSSILKNNSEAHVDYIRITKENTDTLHDIVEQAITSNPLDNALAYACMSTKHIQELLVYVSDTCPSSPSRSEKLVVVTPMNKARKVTYAKTSTTSKNNKQKRVDLDKTQTTSKPLVPSTSVTSSTNASGSIPKRLGLHQLTLGYISSGLVQNPISPTPYVPPSKKDYEILFQPLFDEYFNPTPRAVSPNSVVVAAPRAVDPAGSPSSTTIDQDVPSADPSSEETTLQWAISSYLHHLNQSFDTLTKLTKNRPLENVIGDPSRPVSTRSQLLEHAIWCYFNANDNLIPFGGKRSGRDLLSQRKNNGENGDSWVSVPQTTQENGTSVTKMSIPVTAEEKTNKKNDVKAMSLLLMALPNEHQLIFSQYPDAKSMFAAIETRFRESLDSIFNRLQKTVSRLAILGVVIAQEDLNSKFLSSLPPEWNTHVVVWMN